jgi:hypothetical protein
MLKMRSPAVFIYYKLYISGKKSKAGHMNKLKLYLFYPV